MALLAEDEPLGVHCIHAAIGTMWSRHEQCISAHATAAHLQHRPRSALSARSRETVTGAVASMLLAALLAAHIGAAVGHDPSGLSVDPPEQDEQACCKGFSALRLENARLRHQLANTQAAFATVSSRAADAEQCDELRRAFVGLERVNRKLRRANAWPRWRVDGSRVRVAHRPDATLPPEVGGRRRCPEPSVLPPPNPCEKGRRAVVAWYACRPRQRAPSAREVANAKSLGALVASASRQLLQSTAGVPRAEPD
jgi:hypothetical protein